MPHAVRTCPSSGSFTNNTFAPRLRVATDRLCGRKYKRREGAVEGEEVKKCSYCVCTQGKTTDGRWESFPMKVFLLS
ncbi:unnamed protein product [Cercopithifilaria johnstoni]|uniref:Uncharacterized protein n=1 Tax=Cercopithifilaria johnstoni TaxID=2874296 RepID=A0A8J2PUC8_9BILA|nr:unnamed protein product [Cercopithifilaria johnstoni]